MKACLLLGAKDLRATDLPEPVAGPGEVVIAMRRAGICGSDMHYSTHGQIGSFIQNRSMGADGGQASETSRAPTHASGTVRRSANQPPAL